MAVLSQRPATTHPPLVALECPYPGLRPYHEQDAELFFGREAESEIVTANLLATRLTVLYGASGVGKSSILRAGVAQGLRETAASNLAKTGTPEVVPVYFNRWSSDPLTGLTAAIQEAIRQSVGHDPASTDPGEEPGSLAAQIARWTSGPLRFDLLLILDQFEEYFLYHPPPAAGEPFAVAFEQMANQPDLRVNMLISIREDALAKLDRFKGRIPGLLGNFLRIDQLGVPAARDAIQRPLEMLAKLPQTADPVTADPELVDEVIRQVQVGKLTLGTSGQGAVGGPVEGASERIEASYLQLVLTSLWARAVEQEGSRRLRLATLEELGGAERIVRTHLDQAMAKLPMPDQEVATRIFHYLVTPSGSKIGHTGPDLAKYAELPPAQVAAVLERLASSETRILRPVGEPASDSSEPRYEISHDILAPAILDWRARYLTKAKLRTDYRRRLFMIVGAALLLIVVVLALAGWAALDANRRAQRDRAAAKSAQATATSLATAFSPQEEELLRHVPKDFRATCTRARSPAQADAVVVCTPPTGVNNVWYYAFGTTEKMYGWYFGLVDEKSIPHGSGNCKKDQVAEGTYTREGNAAGHLVCYRDGGKSYTLWTNDKLTIAGAAYRNDLNDATLYQWWTNAGPLDPGTT
jgi:hypothetical protein